MCTGQSYDVSSMHPDTQQPLMEPYRIHSKEWEIVMSFKALITDFLFTFKNYSLNTVIMIIASGVIISNYKLFLNEALRIGQHKGGASYQIAYS